MNNDIEILLNQFEGSYVEKIDFDIFNHKISISLIKYENEMIKEKHLLVFEDVSAFFFENDIDERRFNINVWEKAEISEIHYYKKSKNTIYFKSETPDFPIYSANVNYFIEIWCSLFLVEAKSIVVDGIRFIT